jgi:hypothetical protein
MAVAAAWLWTRAEDGPELPGGLLERAVESFERPLERSARPAEIEPAPPVPDRAAAIPGVVGTWRRLSTPSPSSSSPIAALLERDGTVLIASKTDVVRYEPGGARPGTVLATSRAAAAALGLRYVAFAALGAGADALWIGTWKGALFELRPGALLAVAAEAAEVGRIHAIHDDGDGPWIAARGGLWRLDRGARRLAPVEGLPAGEARSVARAATGELHVALGSSIWARTSSGTWSLRWMHPDGAFLTKILVRRDGALLVGSRRGFAVFREGRGAPRIELAEHWVTDFAITPGGGFSVATWDRALLRPSETEGAEWSALSPAVIPDASLSFALADPAGSVWLGFYAAGVRTFRVDGPAPRSAPGLESGVRKRRKRGALARRSPVASSCSGRSRSSPSAAGVRLDRRP